MKFKKTIVVLSVMLSTATLSTTATADIFTDAGDALVELYDDFVDKWNNHSPELDWPIGYAWGLDANNDYVETTSYTEPKVDYLGYFDKWSEVHAAACPNTNKFRDMPITNETSNYVTKNGVSIKSLTVQQNVPFRFKSKVHGGLTDLLTDSYYFWSFGNGNRRFNRKPDRYDTSYAYSYQGKYLLSSVVYSTEMYIGIQIGGGFDEGSWTVNDLKFKDLIYESDVVYLEGCDIAEVNVVLNNAPTARSRAYLGNSGTSITSFYFDGGSSSDPDGNPLTYSWTYNGVTRTGERVSFSFPTHEVLTKQYTVTLTVTDGDKSDSTNQTINVQPYCYSCNGQQRP